MAQGAAASGGLDPDQLAEQWLNATRRFEAEAGRRLGAAQREALRGVTLDQLAVLGRMPLGPLDEASAEQRLALSGDHLKAVLDEMLAQQLLERRPGARAGAQELIVTGRGRRIRRALDDLQVSVLTSMFEAIGPDLASRIVDAVDFASQGP